MKKLFFFSLLIIFVAFSSCSDNENNTDYLDNSLIEGVWHSELKSIDEKYSIDSTIFYFNNNDAYSVYYAKIADLDTLKFEGKTKYGRYLLTNFVIVLPDAPYGNGLQFRYRLKMGVVDSLFLYEPEHDSWRRYSRLNIKERLNN